MDDFEKPTDIEMALFWIRHIEDPCSLEHEGKLFNLRGFYLREAMKLLDNHNFENPYARKLLERRIREYS